MSRVNLFPLPAAPARNKYRVRRTDDAVLSSPQCRGWDSRAHSPLGPPCVLASRRLSHRFQGTLVGPGAEPFGVFIEGGLRGPRLSSKVYFRPRRSDTEAASES